MYPQLFSEHLPGVDNPKLVGVGTRREYLIYEKSQKVRSYDRCVEEVVVTMKSFGLKRLISCSLYNCPFVFSVYVSCINNHSYESG